MTAYENDVLEIPEKYLNMTREELEAEKKRLLQEIKSKPTEKRIPPQNKRGVIFNW